MNERNIKLTIEEPRGHWIAKHRFVISVTDAGVEIRRESEPVATRDSSVVLTVGREPDFFDLVLNVEEASC